MECGRQRSFSCPLHSLWCFQCAWWRICPPWSTHLSWGKFCRILYPFLYSRLLTKVKTLNSKRKKEKKKNRDWDWDLSVGCYQLSIYIHVEFCTLFCVSMPGSVQPGGYPGNKFCQKLSPGEVLTILSRSNFENITNFPGQFINDPGVCLSTVCTPSQNSIYSGQHSSPNKKSGQLWTPPGH